MNEQYLDKRVDPLESVEGTDKRTNNPVVNSDLFADRVPVDGAHIRETPMGGTLAAAAPLHEPLADEIPMYETPLQEIPMGGTVAAVGPMVEKKVDEAPMVETIPYQTPVGEMATHEAAVVTSAASSAALLSHEESEKFRTQWNEIQGKFVDEPRAAVQQADALVSEVVANITQMFAKNHNSLEGQWNQGNDVSTEDLRKALQQYRSFFNRLVV